MMTARGLSQLEFYKQFLMGRGKFDPGEFRVNMTSEWVTDQDGERVRPTYHGQWTTDELCLRRREAMRFCDEMRRT